MYSPLETVLHLRPHRDLRLLGAVVAVAAAGGVATYIAHRRKPTAEELERRRCDALAASGRLTDGLVLDARTLHGEESHAPEPEVLVYSYELGGVTYECAQDVSRMPERVRGFRLDQPIQVRYDPRNPGNSVVVTESWSGLRPR